MTQQKIVPLTDKTFTRKGMDFTAHVCDDCKQRKYLGAYPFRGLSRAGERVYASVCTKCRDMPAQSTIGPK